MDKQLCMSCKIEFDKEDLTWVNDNYGIPYKKVCYDCEEEVTREIRANNYGDELTHDELYGEEDIYPNDLW